VKWPKNAITSVEQKSKIAKKKFCSTEVIAFFGHFTQHLNSNK
jgi:hypothetical protein